MKLAIDLTQRTIRLEVKNEWRSSVTHCAGIHVSYYQKCNRL